MPVRNSVARDGRLYFKDDDNNLVEVPLNIEEITLERGLEAPFTGVEMKGTLIGNIHITPRDNTEPLTDEEWNNIMKNLKETL